MSFGSFFIFNAIIPPFDRAFRFRNEINLKLTEVQGDRNKIWKQEWKGLHSKSANPKLYHYVFKINFEMINSKAHFEPKNDSH